MDKKTSRAYCTYIGAMFIYGTIGIFQRNVTVSSALLACTRGFLGALVLCIFVKLRGGKIFHNIGKKNVALLALSGGLMGANWIFLFEAYNRITVSVATLCYYMEPTILILLSPLVFGEKLTGRKLFCVACSLVGMVLVSGIVGGSGLGEMNPVGIVCGLAAAALYACVVILNKKIEVDDAYEKTILQLLSAGVVLLPYVLATEDFSAVVMTPISAVMVLVIGIVHTGIAYAMYFGSMRCMKAQSIAVLGYIDPVSALILSGIFLSEKLSVYGILGAVLIIGAAVFSELKMGKTIKKSRENA